MNYLADKIMNVVEKKFAHSPAYVNEKRESLEATDKFQSLIFLNHFDNDIQEDIAAQIGVSMPDLQVAMRVMSQL